MPGRFRGFTVSRGGDGWEMDWDAYPLFVKALGAAKEAIDICMELGVEEAKANHSVYPPASDPFTPFADRSGQTIDAIAILDRARVEPPGWYMPDVPPHVWGRWGVEDRPRINDDGTETGYGTAAIAMFLEFGTIHMEPRPFLYPAWDATKVLMPTLMAAAYRAMSTGRSRFTGDVHL